MPTSEAGPSYRLAYSYTPEIMKALMAASWRRSGLLFLKVFGAFGLVVAVMKGVKFARTPPPLGEALTELASYMLPFAVLYFVGWLVVRGLLSVNLRWRRRRSPLLQHPVSVSLDVEGVAYESVLQKGWYAWPAVETVSGASEVIVLWINRCSAIPLPVAELGEDADRVLVQIERWRAAASALEQPG